MPESGMPESGMPESGMTERRGLVVFAKEPVAGRVKTRLAAEIGGRRATALYEASLRDVVAAASEVEARLLLSFEPARAARFFARLAPRATLLVQPPGDLGARLRSAFEVAAGLGLERVLGIGSDVPHVRPAWLRAGFEALERAPLVLGPTRDGGYWAVGIATAAAPAAARALFEGVRWSTVHTLADTERRAAQLGLALEHLPATFDVDLASDLGALRAELAAHPDRCRHTRAWFERGEHP